MQQKPQKAQCYAAPDFIFQPQADELNPTPPDLTTTMLDVQTPLVWVSPQQASVNALERWPFANNYMYRLVMEKLSLHETTI